MRSIGVGGETLGEQQEREQETRKKAEERRGCASERSLKSASGSCVHPPVD